MTIKEIISFGMRAATLPITWLNLVLESVPALVTPLVLMRTLASFTDQAETQRWMPQVFVTSLR